MFAPRPSLPGHSLFSLSLCWQSSQRLPCQHLRHLPRPPAPPPPVWCARSQAIPGCTAQRICCGSPHWADGVMGFMERLEAQRDGKEVSTKVSLVLLSCPHEQGRAVPSEPEPGVCRATLLTAAHLAAWAGASPGRQCWLVLPKAGGQDAVTACSYGRGSRPRLPGGKVRAPGRGGVWSRADLVPSVSLCRRSLSQLLASFRLPATLSGGGMG